MHHSIRELNKDTEVRTANAQRVMLTVVLLPTQYGKLHAGRVSESSLPCHDSTAARHTLSRKSRSILSRSSLSSATLARCSFSRPRLRSILSLSVAFSYTPHSKCNVPQSSFHRSEAYTTDVKSLIK